MKKLISIFPVLLIAIVLGGNFGLREFIHSCTLSGVSHAYILEKADHCPDEVPASCCESKERPGKEEKGCCHTTEKVYQLKFDDFRQYAPAFALVAIDLPAEQTFATLHEQPCSPGREVISPVNGPPLSGFERCIRHCVFRL